jgi:hypothetical protein
MCCAIIRMSKVLLRGASSKELFKQLRQQIHSRFHKLANSGYGICEINLGFCLGPRCMRGGDVVFAIKGLDLACVLRPVGLAYLYGVMDGEAVNETTVWEDVRIV